ncbi:MAG: 4-hydroxy-tetrahydrodipicolinate synthase [Cellvibrionaceae bacterium]|nr:4-hydroxy-tetrahydrodipicolinate synthase [Cellvibrionaceae bacterium]
MLQGSMVALVTPMQANGELDREALNRLVDFHLDNGTDAIVAVGTSGESATLSVREHLQVVEQVVERVNGRIPVIAGTGANATGEAIELTRIAKRIGVDACLLVVPYYNKPTQQGIYQHYLRIADTVAVPQILYNVPSRTITDMSDEVALQLAVHENIIGIKDATGDMARAKTLIAGAPENFSVYSGDDLSAAELMLLGGKGNISVTANIIPQRLSQLCTLAMAAKTAQAQALQAQLMPLHRALFVEPNPIPVKWALHLMGYISEGIRLPLTPLSAACHQSLQAAMTDVGLLENQAEHAR